MIFIFSITRNPWDRVVSWYNFVRRDKVIEYNCKTQKLSKEQTKKAKEYYKDLTFHRFLREHSYIHNITNSKVDNFLANDKWFYYNNQLYTDYIIRLENFENDIKILFPLLKIDSRNALKLKYSQKDGKLEHNDHHTQLNKKYREYYETEQDIQIVRDKYFHEIRLFNYTY